MTMRLSHSSFTGTERTEVAVGTDKESSMLATVRAGAPRSTVYVGWSRPPDGSGASFSLGPGAVVSFAGCAAAASGLGGSARLAVVGVVVGVLLGAVVGVVARVVV